MTSHGDALTELTAAEMARLLRDGAIGCEELVEAHIRRIQAVNDALNAVVVPLFDEARRAAAAAQRALDAGETVGSLHGVPVTVKESFPVAGTDCTWGVQHRVGRPSTEDGPLIRRVRMAGAIILGKTNCSQLLMGGCSNPVYGRTNNPWDLERSPGGSSSGEGAIIAAQGSPLGLGGDLGGSIRGPSHYCGIHGFKPTTDRLTNADNPPELGAHGRLAVQAQKGPMARSVQDLILAMGVLVRSEGERPQPDLPPPVPWQDPGGVEVRELRVGVFTDNELFTPHPAIVQAVETAAAQLRQLGIEVVPFASPGDAKEAAILFRAILGADGGAWIRRSLAGETPQPSLQGILRRASLSKAERQREVRALRQQGQYFAADMLAAGGAKTAAEYWELVVRRDRYRISFLEAMDAQNLDLLLCPPHGLPAPLHDDDSSQEAGSYLNLFNLLGMPAGVVAAACIEGGEEAGLPVAVQVVGRHWQDHVVLALMTALEARLSALPGYPVRPALG